MSDEQPRIRAADVFRTTTEGCRPLTTAEIRQIAKAGFPDLARRLVAGTCPECGLNRTSATHIELCESAGEPLPAPTTIRQPWEPRPPR
ncbi:MAG: hypothetical protein M3376_01765 [Actinomycetota bacterium]|nr:hypothetical protein [Actinomycetota bacterium]